MSSSEQPKDSDPIPGITPSEKEAEVVEVNNEENKSNVAEVESPKSYQELGQERITRAADRVKGWGSSLGKGAASLWGKVKGFGSGVAGAGKTAFYAGMAAPEMVRDAGKAAVAGAEIAVGYAGEKVEEGGIYLSGKYIDVMEGTRDKYQAVAGRVGGAYESFTGKIKSIGEGIGNWRAEYSAARAEVTAARQAYKDAEAKAARILAGRRQKQAA